MSLNLLILLLSDWTAVAVGVRASIVWEEEEILRFVGKDIFSSLDSDTWRGTVNY
jgi:hypothetical protein